MFETLKEAVAPMMGATVDSSSLSEYAEGAASASPLPEDASDPGFDDPDFDAAVANGVNDRHNAVDFEANDDTEEIPFHNHPRWREVMGQKRALEEELKGLKGFAPVVERLKGLGFGSAAEFEAALAAETQRQFEANLAQALNAGVRNGTLTPAAAQ
ncbi:MAG TPA: hypothetical protein VFW40_12850, partial [Capsulimonadaceae bacterium]|nr:hypothetical protein [Capsulimonadaceae bacterium]